MRLPTIRTEQRHRQWCVRLRWQRRDIRWSAGESQPEAEALAARIKVAIAENRFDGTRASLGIDEPDKSRQRSGEWTLRDLTREYFKYKKSRKHRNAEGLNAHLDYFLAHEKLGKYADRPIARVDRATIGEVVDDLYNSKSTIATANRYIATLTGMFTFAVNRGKLDVSPVRVKREAEETGRDFYLTREQVDGLIEACPAKMKSLVFLAPRIGARQGELLGMTWTDVDFDRGVIVFRRTKNKKQHREVPMTAEVRAELKQLREENEEADFVFVDEEGERLLPNYVRKTFVKARKAAKLYRVEHDDDGTVRWVWARFHDLRHSFASWTLAVFPDLAYLQYVMGHSNIATTMRYAHLMPDANRRFVEAMDAAAERFGQVVGQVEEATS